jgi:hypothetical protein
MPNLPLVHVIRLTEEREIAPYIWVHPDEEQPAGSLRRAFLVTSNPDLSCLGEHRQDTVGDIDSNDL